MTRRGDDESKPVVGPNSPDPWDFDEVLAYFATSAYDYLWDRGITLEGFQAPKDQITQLSKAERTKVRAAANALLRVWVIRKQVERRNCKDAVLNAIDLVANARRMMPLDEDAVLGRQTRRWRSLGGKEAHREKRALHPIYREYDRQLKKANPNLSPSARAGLIAERIMAERGISVHSRTVYRQIRPSQES